MALASPLDAGVSFAAVAGRWAGMGSSTASLRARFDSPATETQYSTLLAVTLCHEFY
jgi:acyl-coenzyme A thioesterase PaaI-like protein